MSQPGSGCSDQITQTRVDQLPICQIKDSWSLPLCVISHSRFLFSFCLIFYFFVFILFFVFVFLFFLLLYIFCIIFFYFIFKNPFLAKFAFNSNGFSRLCKIKQNLYFIQEILKCDFPTMVLCAINISHRSLLYNI